MFCMLTNTPAICIFYWRLAELGWTVFCIIFVIILFLRFFMKSTLGGVGAAGVFFGSAFLTAVLSYPCGNSVACRSRAISTSLDSAWRSKVSKFSFCLDPGLAVPVVFMAPGVMVTLILKGETVIGWVTLVVVVVVDCSELLDLFDRLFVSSLS